MTCPKCNAELTGEQCAQCAAPETAKASGGEEGRASGEPPEATPAPENTGEGASNTKATEDDDDLKAAAGSNEPGGKKGGEEPTKPVPPVTTTVKESEIGELLQATGYNNKIINKKIINLRPSDRPPTLFDFMDEIPPPKNNGKTTTFDDAELEDASRRLEEQRLLLLVCSDRDAVRAASDALVGRVAASTRRILSFNGLPAELSFDVHGLTRRATRKTEMLVVVDAFEGERARNFVDSLFAEGAYGTDRIAMGLKRVRLRIACITSEESIVHRISRLDFEHWMVSSARILLRKELPQDFESVESRIAEQRRQGNWSRSAAEFRKQLEEVIRSGELRAVVDKGGPLSQTGIAAPDEPAVVADPENVLNLAVLYTATFYSNLSATEFVDVVSLIIGDQRTLVPESVQQKTKDGSFKMVELKREKPLVEIWTARTDAVLRENRLVTSRDAGRAVTFADIGRRDILRRHFEEQYGAYVLRQFLMTWEKGLLYERSTRVASTVITLTVEMVLSDGDQFDREWLVERILHFCETNSDPVFVLRRSADLLRTMLRHPPLDTVVNAVVHRLLQLGEHASALTIVKALRLTPEFDDLYWLQQILDRGSAEVREEARSYLFNELRRADIGIERYVTTLADKWLPATDRDPASYSHSNKAGLLAMFAYCFEVTAAFEESQYGAWPSRFPIIAPDATSAARQFGAVLRSLLHPGLLSVLDGDLVPAQLLRELALLISEWVFILFGDSDETPDSEDEAIDFTREQALTALVAQLLAATASVKSRALRALLVDQWEWAKEIYIHAPWLYGEEGHRRRREFGRKRRLVHDLITEFRRQQRAEQKSANTKQASA